MSNTPTTTMPRTPFSGTKDAKNPPIPQNINSLCQHTELGFGATFVLCTNWLTFIWFSSQSICDVKLLPHWTQSTLSIRKLKSLDFLFKLVHPLMANSCSHNSLWTLSVIVGHFESFVLGVILSLCTCTTYVLGDPSFKGEGRIVHFCEAI